MPSSEHAARPTLDGGRTAHRDPHRPCVRDPSLAPLVRFSSNAVDSGIAALQRGCAIYTDVTMVGAGLYRPWLQQLGCEVVCVIQDPEVAEKAKEWGTTRAIASMRHLGERMSGNVVAIGNAPTALLALLDQVDAGQPRRP